MVEQFAYWAVFFFFKLLVICPPHSKYENNPSESENSVKIKPYKLQPSPLVNHAG